MPLSSKSKLVYRYLVQEAIPSKKVVTYGEVSAATGVLLGKGGGAVSDALYEIFLECDIRMLPPLSVIVVQEDNLFDGTRRHGMPGGGYLAAEATSKNLAKRRRDSGWERWGSEPRPADLEIWAMKGMIEAHQDMVWNYSYQWPELL